jgi:hypothetical protein
MTAYTTPLLAPADFRPGTALWPDIVLTTQQAQDAPLVAEIAGRASEFDDLIGDHFELLAAQTITFPGNGQAALPTPGYRLISVSTLTLVHPDGSTTVLDPVATPWRARPWGIELTSLTANQGAPENYFGNILPTYAYFPRRDTIQLGGVSYGWAAVPTYAKRAVALLVFDRLAGSNIGHHRAVRWTEGKASYEINSGNVPSLTGLPEVDRIIFNNRMPYLAVA